MFVAYFVLFGAFSMLGYEGMAMIVDPKAYFSSGWNWLDLMQPTMVLALFSIIKYTNNHSD